MDPVYKKKTKTKNYMYVKSNSRYIVNLFVLIDLLLFTKIHVREAAKKVLQ